MLYTDVACPLPDLSTCRCRDYRHRHDKVPDCVEIRHLSDAHYRWLPATCAYRLAHEGKPLQQWHPWVSGDRASVHAAGISLLGRVEDSCDGMDEEELTGRIIGPG